MTILFISTVFSVGVAALALFLLVTAHLRHSPPLHMTWLLAFTGFLSLTVMVGAIFRDCSPFDSLAALACLAAALGLRRALKTEISRKSSPSAASDSPREDSLGDADEWRKTIMLFSVFNSMKEMVLVVNRNGMVVFMNQAAVDILGDQIGMVCGEVLHCERDACRVCSVRSSGHENDAPELAELTLGGRLYEITRNRMRNDEDGRVIITARDATERRMVERQLVVNEKMMSLGQLVAGVAHEINNPITFVFTNLELLTMAHGVLRDYLGKVDELLHTVDELGGPALAGVTRNIREYAELSNLTEMLDQLPLLVADLTEGVERVRKIVKDLKDFSHPGGTEPEDVDLNAVLEQTLRIAHNELKQRVRVELHLTEGMPPLLGLPQQLKQAALNLVVNAAQAMEATPKDRAVLTLHTDFDDDRYTIRISDTGKGIPAEHLGQIFDPFFTSKEVGKGTGLGLAVVYGIIQRHGGDIQVRSTLGEGTTFTVTLPRQMPAANGKPRPGLSIYSLKSSG